MSTSILSSKLSSILLLLPSSIDSSLTFFALPVTLASSGIWRFLFGVDVDGSEGELKLLRLVRCRCARKLNSFSKFSISSSSSPRHFSIALDSLTVLLRLKFIKTDQSSYYQKSRSTDSSYQYYAFLFTEQLEESCKVCQNYHRLIFPPCSSIDQIFWKRNAAEYVVTVLSCYNHRKNMIHLK